MTPPPEPQSQTPVRSRSQRIEALGKANEIRSKRAQLKKDIKAGKVQLVDMLESPPEYLLTGKVLDMLLVVPKLGRVKATRVLTRCRISQAKTIGGLSDRQRAELIDALKGRG